ncbi:MAG TPA: helix-turn-helix transcriptional regulator, partial [Clostridia bacterium]|nr:helix-turn-helix transcriptional regulator [Clostridia bacterium]
MGTRERPRDRAFRSAEETVAAVARELRLARTSAGLSLREVAAAAGVSHTKVWHIEHGRTPDVSVLDLAVIASATGLRLGLRLWPDGDPIRDA